MSVFKDRVAIVTGGAAGIGRALCEQLGREGSTVVAVDVDARAVQEAAQAIERAGGAGVGDAGGCLVG